MDDTFDKIGAALGNRLDEAMKKFMQDVVDQAAGVSKMGPGSGMENFSAEQLKTFVKQLGGVEFGYGFLSATPKLQGALIRPSVLLPTGMSLQDSKAIGFEGSIGCTGTIRF